MSPLQSGLHGFCGAWRRCNSLEWGALERRTRGPAKRGSGSVGDAATAFRDARIPLRGHTFLRKALFHPARSHHSASFRLTLHRKNHTLRPVQLPDLGLIEWKNAALVFGIPKGEVGEMSIQCYGMIFAAGHISGSSIQQKPAIRQDSVFPQP